MAGWKEGSRIYFRASARLAWVQPGVLRHEVWAPSSVERWGERVGWVMKKGGEGEKRGQGRGKVGRGDESREDGREGERLADCWKFGK